MTKPMLVFNDNGVQYSEWVIGEYDNTSVCPYRIVRRGKKEGEREFWESPDCLGPDEDVWAIREPDAWTPLKVKRG